MSDGMIQLALAVIAAVVSLGLKWLDTQKDDDEGDDYDGQE